MRWSRRTSSMSSGERQAARLLDPRGAEATHQAEQRIHAPHPRPGQRPVEQRGRVPRDVRTVLGGLRPQRLDIAEGVYAPLGRIVVRIDDAAARRLPGMGLDQRRPDRRSAPAARRRARGACGRRGDAGSNRARGRPARAGHGRPSATPRSGRRRASSARGAGPVAPPARRARAAAAGCASVAGCRTPRAPRCDRARARRPDRRAARRRSSPPAPAGHCARRVPWHQPRIAPRDAHLPQVFTVTHPFHPLNGQTFDLLTYRWNWGEDRVMYVRPDGRTRSLPVGWTSIAPVDPFVTVAAGRAAFRLEDLLALTALVRDIEAARSAPGQSRRSRVK